MSPTDHSIAAVQTTEYVVGTTVDVTYPAATISPNFCARTFEVNIASVTGISKTTVANIKVVRFNLADLTYLTENNVMMTQKDYNLQWQSTIVGYYTDNTDVVSRTDAVTVKNPCVLAEHLEFTQSSANSAMSYPVGTAAMTINYNAYSARFKLIGLNVSICGSLKNTFFYNNV